MGTRVSPSVLHARRHDVRDMWDPHGGAIDNAGRPVGEVQEAVQSSAREEIVKMNAGLPILEVVINIAPLLGLLGTASGLVIVFRDLGAAANHVAIAKGISMALNTTIVGLGVAVPSVIAHSHFSRKIETMSARLEVLLGQVVSALRHHVLDGRSAPKQLERVR